ncbi:UNVERIFIED_ORG: secreted PhoX family phosphatase [Pseudomonas vranovensis]|nr:secreted PhoX family phosphatase [Pseudomonas vranovensis]
MHLLEEHQPTDLEQLTSLSRRRFIGAGALCGAALFLGGNLLSRSVLAASVSAGNSSLLGFASIPAATADSISLPPGYKASVLITLGPATACRRPGLRSFRQRQRPGPGTAVRRPQ